MPTPYEILWLFVVPAALFSWYHIVRQLAGFIPPQAKLPPGPYPQIIFSIAARSLTPALKQPVDAIRNSCAAVGFSNFKIMLVVDKAGNPLEGAETLVVPKEFICKSQYKARALHYQLQHLPNSQDVWTLHLDEDALVTPQCVVSIISYIQNGGNPVANGPSVFPYDGNLLTFYAESQRQWTFYWLKDQEISSIVHWLNGSNLLIRTDIEHAVGWDFVNCFISEDARFGYEATKKFGSAKIFGWHGGLTIETPPGSVQGLLKQRMRWFWGSILNLRYVPRARLPRRIYSITSWFDGLILTVFAFFIVTHIYPWRRFSDAYLLWGLSITGVLWLARYQIGVYQNLRLSKLSRIKKILLHIGIIPLAPVADFLCNLPTLMALIKRPKAFEITAKKPG
jgi:cellulose synthase/poly-beta-1,6-N-acetylglucosamine synthase-like glycosyltransferase